MGLAGNDRFDWLVDRTLELPSHTLPGSADPDQASRLRPEFKRLYDKFRIGKTHYTYPDPAGDGELTGIVRPCSACHAADPPLAESPVGYTTAQLFLDRTRGLASLIGRAERTLLAGRRGGVEVRRGPLELDKAVDSEIELQVLVHGFSAGDSSAFMLKHAEGIHHAQSALAVGAEALDEIGNRRSGLFVALALILVSLVGLGLRIRQMESEE
jgi:hypothetical protein